MLGTGWAILRVAMAYAIMGMGSLFMRGILGEVRGRGMGLSMVFWGRKNLRGTGKMGRRTGLGFC